MSFSDVRKAMAEKLATVDGIGQIYEYVRHESTWAGLYNNALKDGRVNVWEVTRLAAGQEIIGVETAVGTEPFYHDSHVVAIIARLGVSKNGESEKDFQDIIDRAVTAVRLDPMLGGVVLLPKSLQVPTIEHRMFGDVLVHFAIITYEAIERVGG